jgi:predicted metallopeptidase
VIGNVVIVAQSAITGTWKSDNYSDKKDREDGKIHLSFERRTDNGRNQHGSSISYADLQGLTREQTQNGKVSFRLVREAGTVECEGTFANGKGSGTFRFTPDSGYLSAMKSRGFDFEKSKNGDDGVEGRLLSAALINVTTAQADDLKSVGFGNLDVDDLFKAAIFKVDSRFMAEMKATGFPNLTMEDLVKARIFKIDADFVRRVNDMGYGTKDFEQLVKYSIFKVTPEYLAELKAAGFDNLSAEEVVKFRIFKVTPELLTDLRNEGFSNLSAEEVVKFRIFNIDKEFMRKAKAEDPNVTVEDMVKMKIGVRRMKGSN